MIRFVTGLVLALAVHGAFAANEEQRGLEIAQRAHFLHSEFGDSAADLSMILRNSRGDEVERRMRMLVLEVKGDGDKTITVFDEPADVKGTALLTYAHGIKNDDQWLYMPALKRVKRINSNNKSGPFMGSEFAYEDIGIGQQQVEKYTYRYLRDEDFNGESCFVVERYPAYEFSGYTRQVVWYDKSEYRTRQVQFYDRKDALLKTLVFLDFKRYLDRFWRANQMKMDNHQTGKSTTLSWHDYRFGTGLKEDNFTVHQLERTR